MDIVTGYTIALVSFWLGWLAALAFSRNKGGPEQQAQDDAEQREYLEQHHRRKAG